MIRKKTRKTDIMLNVQCPCCGQRIPARNSGLTHYSCPKCCKPFFSFADIFK